MCVVADYFIEDGMYEGVVGGREVFGEDLGLLRAGDGGWWAECVGGEVDGGGEGGGEDGVLVGCVAGDEGVGGARGEEAVGV